MKARGYTLIEVMMALSVLAFGASGVIAMQKATLISNTNARNLATANAVAQSWMERLRADALSWNEALGANDLVTDTQWLRNASVGQFGSGWFIPTAVPPKTADFPAGSPSADILGSDVYSYPAVDPFTPAFCTQLRLTRFSDVNTGQLAALRPLIRAEVRVFWARAGQRLDCANPPSAQFASSTGVYGFVYLVSAVLENGAPS